MPNSHGKFGPDDTKFVDHAPPPLAGSIAAVAVAVIVAAVV